LLILGPILGTAITILQTDKKDGKSGGGIQPRTLLFSAGPALVVFTLVATVYISYIKMVLNDV